MELKYKAGVGALVLFSIMLLVLQGSGAKISHDGDKVCFEICESTITIQMGGNDVSIEDFYLLSPQFSKEPLDYRVYYVVNSEETYTEHIKKNQKPVKKIQDFVLKKNRMVDIKDIKQFTFKAWKTYQFKIIGLKNNDENIKWSFDFKGFGYLDPWWNSSTVTVNITPYWPTQWDSLNCSWNITNNDTIPYNASITWFINNTRNVSFDANRTNLTTGYFWTNVTFNLSSSLMYSNFSCAVNLSNSSTSTGFIYSLNVTPMNFNISLPIQYNESNITYHVQNVSLICAESFVNGTQPNGQTHFIPIFNLSSRNSVNNITNITLRLGQNLTGAFEIVASDVPFITNNSINLTTNSQVIIKSMTGFNFTESQKGIWMYGNCFNVTENVTNNISFILEGGR